MSDREFLLRRSQAQLVLDALGWGSERVLVETGNIVVVRSDSDDEADTLRERLRRLVGKGFDRPQSEWNLNLKLSAAPTPIPQSGDGARPVPGRHAAERRHTDAVGATIGILDTGICPHPYLAGAFVASAASIYDNERQVLDGDEPINRASSHATFVAGIVAQQAPNARILVHKVLDDQHAATTIMGLADGLVRLREMGAQVINVSLVTTSPAGVGHAFPLEVALEQVGPDIPVIAAAGNQKTNTPHYPAAFDNVIAVGAAAPDLENGGWVRATFSNHGPWVNLWAPGVKVVSTYIDFPHDGGANVDRSWATWDGTSFSAAIVTGRVAAIMEADGGTAWGAVNQLLAKSPARVDLDDGDDALQSRGPLVEPDPRSGLDYKGR